LQIIEITIAHRSGSASVDIRSTLTPHSEDHLVTARAKLTARHVEKYDLGEQELWELVTALRSEIEGWQARLTLGY